jgi:hypothetical protein
MKKESVIIPIMPIVLILLVLKITGVISISWFWVFAPLLMFIVFGSLTMLFGIMVMFLVSIGMMEDGDVVGRRHVKIKVK